MYGPIPHLFLLVTPQKKIRSYGTAFKPLFLSLNVLDLSDKHLSICTICTKKTRIMPCLTPPISP